MPRVRLHGQNPAHGTRTLLDGNGTQPETIQLIGGEPAGKTEAFTVVVYYEY
jgi:hypothetical protein